MLFSLFCLCVSAVYYDMLPPDKKQSTNSEHVYAAVLSALDARGNVVHSVQQCVPQVHYIHYIIQSQACVKRDSKIM